MLSHRLLLLLAVVAFASLGLIYGIVHSFGFGHKSASALLRTAICSGDDCEDPVTRFALAIRRTTPTESYAQLTTRDAVASADAGAGVGVSTDSVGLTAIDRLRAVNRRFRTEPLVRSLQYTGMRFSLILPKAENEGYLRGSEIVSIERTGVFDVARSRLLMAVLSRECVPDPSKNAERGLFMDVGGANIGYSAAIALSFGCDGTVSYPSFSLCL